MSTTSFRLSALANQPAIGLPRHALYLAIVAVMTATHVLLPIERGFPAIRLAGLPFTLTMLVSVAAAGVLFLESKGRLLAPWSQPYVILQALVVAALLFAALLSNDPVAGLYLVLAYSVTFILDFLILAYLFQRGFRPRFVVVVALVVGAAALIGVVEGSARVLPSFYRNIYLNYDYIRFSYDLTQRQNYRAFGTLGNPILFATALTLAVPFLLELRPRLLGYAIAVLALAAAFFAVSLTGVLVAAVLAAGLVLTSRHRLPLAAVSLVLVVAAVLLLAASRLEAENGSSLALWSEKFNLGENNNIRIRLDMLTQAWHYFLNQSNLPDQLLGHGLKYSAELARTWSSRQYGYGELGTLDNTYASLLIDAGLLGLAAYVAVMAWLVIAGRHAWRTSLHWYAILSMFAAGISFVTVYYSTINLLWVAAVVAIVYDQPAQRRRPSSVGVG
jgi:hypothetical protein